MAMEMNGRTKAQSFVSAGTSEKIGEYEAVLMCKTEDRHALEDSEDVLTIKISSLAT
jgi:hypothetical protein